MNIHCVLQINSHPGVAPVTRAAPLQARTEMALGPLIGRYPGVRHPHSHQGRHPRTFRYLRIVLSRPSPCQNHAALPQPRRQR